MGALRINLTNGTSEFIDLSNVVSVATKDHTSTRFIIEVDVVGIGLQDYVVNRWLTPDAIIGPDMIWDKMMDVAYVLIPLDPIEFGYPDLGGNYLSYIAYDDNKFLSSAIDSALSSVADPAVLENRTAIYGMAASPDDAEALWAALQTEVKNIDAQVTTLIAECKAEVAGAGTYTWPDGYVCTSDECCDAKGISYNAALKAAVAEPYVDDVKWRHQYLFASVDFEGPK